MVPDPGKPGHCPSKIWSFLLIAYHYIVLRDDGAEPSESKDNRQSKAGRLGGGARFFSTHKPTAHAACVACLGNLAALKLPLSSMGMKSFRLAYVYPKDLSTHIPTRSVTISHSVW